jgi:uncharacterized membrane protein
MSRARQVRDPLRHHRTHRRERDFGDGFAQRCADRIAEGIGTTTFLIGALVVIVLWLAVNGGVDYFSGAFQAVLHGRKFDPPEWILLNLVFSFEAFFTGSLVVLAQKAQAKRGRAREEAEATHREELAVEAKQREDEIIDRLDEKTRGGIKTVLDRIDRLEDAVTGRDEFVPGNKT